MGLLITTSLFISAQTTIVDSIISGGIYRSYRLYEPASFTGTSARPLVIDFHGYNSNATNEQLFSNFGPIADTADFLILYPQATYLNGQPYWNSGISNTGVDDVQFIFDLIGNLKNNYPIDPSRIYSCGMSNGGFMSQSLACGLPHKIAAIASVSGSMFYSQYYNCMPYRAVPTMQINGTADVTVPYTGNTTMIPIDTLVHYWVKNDSCNPIPLFTNVPNTDTTDGCTAEHYVYSGGTDGASCELYKIINGTHDAWPGSPYIIGTSNGDFSASLQIWLFFRKYQLDQFVGINELKTADDVNFYPNPCTNFLHIDGEHIERIMIQDMNGKVVIETNKKQIDISSLAKGIYSIVFISENYRSVKKLVKL